MCSLASASDTKIADIVKCIMLRTGIFLLSFPIFATTSMVLDVYDEAACGVDRPRYIHVDREGLISSPNFNLSYEATYPPNSHCEWLINQTGHAGLELKFLNMSLEVSEQCKSDYVEVFKKGEVEDELLGTYCGQEVPPAIVVASPAIILVRFVSDATVEYAGFVARYGFPIDDRECITDLRPQTINASNGMIYSPNWPQHYDNLINCRWLFTAQQNHTWLFNVTHFELEGGCCVCDTLEVFDGDSTDAPRFGAWYGLNTAPPMIRTTGPDMFIRFLTDYTDTFKGFLAFFTQVEDNLVI